MRFYVRAVAVCLLCARAVAQTPATPPAAAPAASTVTFSAVQLGGNAQCLTDTPQIRTASTSAADCENQCVSVLAGSCAAVNYRADTSTCEMFRVASTNYTQVSGCSLYQAQQPAVVCPAPNLCASAPCQHGGTCSRSGINNGYYTCACAPLFTGANCETFFCDQQAKQGCPSAAYTIPALSGKQIYCQNLNGTTWLVFQRRLDGSVDFYRNWTQYEQGFGDATAEFWLGNPYLAQLSSETKWLLRVDLADGAGLTAWAQYDNFNIGPNTTYYKLNSLGAFTGNVSDSLTYHLGMAFSTYEADHDAWGGGSCAVNTHGAWWYNACHYSDLNGHYNDTTLYFGVNWYPWRAYAYSIMKAEMKMRPAV